MKENIQWKIVDCRKEINGEFGLCQNGHECFVSSYLSFKEGKKEIVRCKECGIEILRFAPFRITIEEISTDDEILQEIIAEFIKSEKVIKIVQCHEYDSQISIKIYLDINQYDDELMDKLLDYECDIRKKFSDIIFDFSYLPTILNGPSRGTIIFQRK